MSVTWLHDLYEIRPLFSPYLDLGLDLDVLLSRFRFRFRSESLLKVFNLCSFNLLMLISLHNDSDEDVEYRRAPQAIANGVRDLGVCL